MDLSTLLPWQIALFTGLAISVLLMLILLVVVTRRNLGERRQLDEMRDELEEATRALGTEIDRLSLAQREEQLKSLQKIGDSLANLINRGADQQSSQFSLWQQSAYEHDRSTDGRQARMNPCPCGNHGSKTKPCRCKPYEIQRYLGRISGPLLDRIDIQVEMDAVTIDEIEQSGEQEDSRTVQHRVLAAREKQLKRYEKENYFCNANLTQEGVEKYCAM